MSESPVRSVVAVIKKKRRRRKKRKKQQQQIKNINKGMLYEIWTLLKTDAAAGFYIKWCRRDQIK
jgi:hypothetical protein